MTAVFFIRFSESFLAAPGQIFSKTQSLCMESVLCTRNTTNWGLGRTMWCLSYLVMLSTMSWWGASPPLTASALPHTKPLCPSNEAILVTIQPFCTEKKMYSAELQNVKEMNQWSISGIFNYYSVRCTETMMAAVSLMAVYQTSKQLHITFTPQYSFWVTLLWLEGLNVFMRTERWK